MLLHGRVCYYMVGFATTWYGMLPHGMVYWVFIIVALTLRIETLILNPFFHEKNEMVSRANGRSTYLRFPNLSVIVYFLV